MTVFCMIRAKSDASYAIVSDCLLTSDLQQTVNIDLPFRTISLGANFTTYKLTRKVFFPHPRIMLLWSGSFLFAKTLARYLSSQINRILIDDVDFSFQGIIAECLSENDARQCGFLLMRTFPLGEVGMRIRYHAFNCESAEDDNFGYFGAGSGFQVASAHMWLGPDDQQEEATSEILTALPQALRMVVNLLSNEHFTDTYRYLRAGGWYEIFVPTRNGFQPVPYAINTFVRSGDSWEMINRFSSFYNDGNLVAVRANFDLLAELSVNPSYQINGTEFQIFPVIELHMDSPEPKQVQMTLQNIYGKGSQFALNVFTDIEGGAAYSTLIPGCDALMFGDSSADIGIDSVSLKSILSKLPNEGRLP